MYNFGRLFRGHQYYTLSEFDICLSEEKKILKEKNEFLLYDLFGHALAQESLLWDHEIYNFDGPFLVHHYYALKFFLSQPWGREEVFL